MVDDPLAATCAAAVEEDTQLSQLRRKRAVEVDTAGLGGPLAKGKLLRPCRKFVICP